MNNSNFQVSWRSVIFHNRTPFQVKAKALLPEFSSSSFSGIKKKVPEQLIKPCHTFTWGLKSLGEVVFEVELETTINPKKFPVTLIMSKDYKEYHVVITKEEAVYWDFQNRLSPNEKNGLKRIHVGCGPKNIFPDWWNVDIRSFKGVDTVMDVTKEWPFQDIEFVYGEHFLEHLPLDGAVNFLVSSGNSLKQDGIIRLTTPNLEWVVRNQYPTDDNSYEAKIDGTFTINRAFHGWGHQFLYSQEFLHNLLEQLGYEKIKFFDYGISDTPDLSYLECHGKFREKDGIANLIVVEASRGLKEISLSKTLENELNKSFLVYFKGGH
ncbi:hypothetical protein V6O07_01260 [Arthrospira platensis SPKY2]